MTKLPQDSEPTLPAIPHHGWTQTLKARFLDRLAEDGNAHAACRSVGLSRQSAYRLRRRDRLFGRGWDAAVLLGRMAVEQTLRDFAVEGVPEDRYFRGEYVGQRRRFDGRLLLAHLGRLDRLADEKAAGEDAGRFDELLAQVAGLDSAALAPPTEAALAAEAEAIIEAQRREACAEYYECRPEDLEACEVEKPDPYYRDFLADLEEECEEWADAAREEAGLRLERRRDALFEGLDALCDEAASSTPEPPAPPPAAPPPAVQAALAAIDPATAAPWRAPGAWTVSTVSTAALGRALFDHAAGPRAATPLSPYAAPRLLSGARRRKKPRR